MRTPNTKTARKLIKLAIIMNNARFANTYTEKTSKLDPTRRSVVFMITPSKAEIILATLEQIYRDIGFNSPIKITRRGERSYIRAVAGI
jgi:hypothetical protein